MSMTQNAYWVGVGSLPDIKRHHRQHLGLTYLSLFILLVYIYSDVYDICDVRSYM